MQILYVVTVLLLSTTARTFVLPDPKQISLCIEEDEVDRSTSPPTKSFPRRIAIVGSGITGSAAAFKLAEGFRRRRAPPEQQPMITVFERNEVAGGRITQAYAYNDSRYPVDTCAVSFAAGDDCTSSAATAVGLVVVPNDQSMSRDGFGVWNGKEFVGFVEDDAFRNPAQWSFYRQLKWFKRYGNNPQTSNNEANGARLNFRQLLASPFAPEVKQPGKPNLRKAVQDQQLEDFVQNFVCSREAGDRVFPSGAKGALFVDEVLTAAQRERFFGSIIDLNVLEFLFGYEAQVESSIDGGNLQLIDRLLRIATTDVRLGREVKQITRQLTGDIRLTTESTIDGSTHEETFDVVVLATSIDRSGMKFDPPLDNVTGLGQKYKDSFVTHFTTPNLLDSTYFNRNGTMPQNVLTSQSIDDVYDGKEPLFFSLNLVGRLQNPQDATVQEYLFKLVSREEISNSEIEKMLSKPTTTTKSSITWIDRRPLPQSIPITGADSDQCKTVLEKIEIAPNIYYAGAGEQILGSAEFGCRSGANVANLILDGEQP